MSEEEQQDSNGTMNGDVPEIELIIKVSLQFCFKLAINLSDQQQEFGKRFK